MRRFTLITLVVLTLLLVGAAIYQIALARHDGERFPGPMPGSPLPGMVPSP